MADRHYHDSVFLPRRARLLPDHQITIIIQIYSDGVYTLDNNGFAVGPTELVRLGHGSCASNKNDSLAADLMDESDRYFDFLESISAKLGRAVELFRAGSHAAGVLALEEVVILCESDPAFAVLKSDEIGRVCDVVDGCIRDAMHRRDNVAQGLGSLLQRLEALERTGLH
jgi:hypothetical protein